ncbi:hypothetical protein R3P38DRAFT_2771129 [Favolaschia claudopus]|uniref:Uncharacterized protein n=1 Tax=Favolaschia claudopus TaxID=2862362 RepID=A0AAW0CH12_9AGAR
MRCAAQTRRYVIRSDPLSPAAEAVRKELPALKAGNIYVGQRSDLSTRLLDYTMRKVSSALRCRNSVLERDAWHEAWGGDADWYTPRRPPAHASRLGFLDTPDSFSLPPSALVEAVRSEESPAREAGMVGKAPQFTTSRGWKLTVKGIDCVEGEMAWNGIFRPGREHSGKSELRKCQRRKRKRVGSALGLASQRMMWGTRGGAGGATGRYLRTRCLVPRIPVLGTTLNPSSKTRPCPPVYNLRLDDRKREG